MKLSELKNGETAVIVRVQGHGGFRKRIMEMGFVRGQKVTSVINAPMNDPIKYSIMGYDVSLRRSEANLIEVLSEADADAKLSAEDAKAPSYYACGECSACQSNCLTNLHKTTDCYESNPETNSGLDYTKAVVILKNEYIDLTRFPEIEHKEYNYIKFKEREIKIAFAKFISDYKKDVIRHKKNPSIPENPRFKYCSLQYFKKELGLE